MSDKHKHIAFLCGHFKRTEAVDASALQAAGWLPVNYTDKARQKEKRFYYPDFVDFCYAQSMDEGCVRFKRQVNQSVSIKATQVSPERTLPFTVKEIMRGSGIVHGSNGIHYTRCGIFIADRSRRKL